LPLIEPVLQVVRAIGDILPAVLNSFLAATEEVARSIRANAGANPRSNTRAQAEARQGRCRSARAIDAAARPDAEAGVHFANSRRIQPALTNARRINPALADARGINSAFANARWIESPFADITLANARRIQSAFADSGTADTGAANSRPRTDGRPNAEPWVDTFTGKAAAADVGPIAWRKARRIDDARPITSAAAGAGVTDLRAAPPADVGPIAWR